MGFYCISINNNLPSVLIKLNTLLLRARQHHFLAYTLGNPFFNNLKSQTLRTKSISNHLKRESTPPRQNIHTVTVSSESTLFQKNSRCKGGTGGGEGGHFSSCSIWIYQPSQSPPTTVGRGGISQAVSSHRRALTAFPRI